MPGGESTKRPAILAGVQAGDVTGDAAFEQRELRVALWQCGAGDQQLPQMVQRWGLIQRIERAVVQLELTGDEPCQEERAGAALKPDQETARLVGSEERVAKPRQGLGDGAVGSGEQRVEVLQSQAAQAYRRGGPNRPGDTSPHRRSASTP